MAHGSAYAAKPRSTWPLVVRRDTPRSAKRAACSGSKNTRTLSPCQRARALFRVLIPDGVHADQTLLL